MEESAKKARAEAEGRNCTTPLKEAKQLTLAQSLHGGALYMKEKQAVQGYPISNDFCCELKCN